jgi:hypothetical protein
MNPASADFNSDAIWRDHTLDNLNMYTSPLKSFGRALISSALCALAVANAPIASASTTEGPFTIKSVIIGGYGAHLEVTPAPVTCTANWAGTQLVILKEAPNYKDMLAGVLAAQAQGKPVIAWHDPQGNGNCGFGNQKSVNTIQIKS